MKIALITAFSILATSSSSLAVDFKEVGRGLTEALLVCPQRVWPGYDFRERNVLLVADGESPVLWRGSTGRLEPFAQGEIPEDVLTGLYDFPTIDGKRQVGGRCSREQC